MFEACYIVDIVPRKFHILILHICCYQNEYMYLQRKLASTGFSATLLLTCFLSGLFNDDLRTYSQCGKLY